MGMILRGLMTISLLAVIVALLISVSSSRHATQQSDVIIIALEDITFQSPPGWTFGVNAQTHKDLVHRVNILPISQKGFIYHDQLMVSKLLHPPDIKPDWQIKTSAHWQYVDLIQPSDHQSRESPSIFVRFLNHGDLWYVVSYVASLTESPMDKNMARYDIQQNVWESINSIRFDQKTIASQGPDSMASPNESH